MNGILGMARLLLNTPLDERQRDNINTMLESGEALLTVLNDILDFTKLEAGKLDLVARDFDFPALIESVASLQGSRARAKGVELSVNVAPDVPRYLCADGDRLRQVLSNLVGNAVTFTERGAVAVDAEVATEDGAVLWLRIAVSDTGIGIAPDAQAKLFGDFIQADATIARRFGGTGLGLSISKRLIEQMGGRIGLQSKVGRGSVFWIEVPLARGEAPDEPAVPAPTPLAALKVLLAEDNFINQKVVVGILANHGHKVDVVENGALAVEGVKAGHYDIVLMDVHMPVMDGITATRMIRGNGGAHARVPIIAVSAGAMESEIQACLMAGMTDFVVKPVHPRTLMDTMARALGHRSPADAPLSRSDARAQAPLDRDREDELDERILNALAEQLGAQAMVELAEDFDRNAERLLASMTLACDAGDRAGWRLAAHSLKGAAASLGLKRVVELAHSIERAADTGRVADAGPLISILPDAIRSDRAALASRLVRV